MQCISCNNEVSSKFAHALKSNCCPFCGSLIMKAELQIILKSLYETMTEATELSYEAQALAWFSSNFNMVSRESEELAELHKTIEQLTKELQVSQEKSVKPVPKSGRIQMTNEEVQMGVDDGGFPVQLQGPPIQD